MVSLPASARSLKLVREMHYKNHAKTRSVYRLWVQDTVGSLVEYLQLRPWLPQHAGVSFSTGTLAAWKGTHLVCFSPRLMQKLVDLRCKGAEERPVRAVGSFIRMILMARCGESTGLLCRQR